MTTEQWLRLVELLVFIALAAITTTGWLVHRGEMRFWLTASFVDLAIISLINSALPHDNETKAPLLVTQVGVCLILLFPFFLYQFLKCFGSTKKWIDVVAKALTAVAFIMTWLFRDFPIPGETKTNYYTVFVVVVAVQWIFILGVVAVGLWRGGNGQGVIARKRMRLLSGGVVGITFALVLALLDPSKSDNTNYQSMITLLVILTAPLFLLGFAPPAAIVNIWRRPERSRFREVEGRLIEAMTPQDVAHALLPLMADYMGGSASLLTDARNNLIAFHGISSEGAHELARQMSEENVTELNDAASSIMTLSLREGNLLIVASMFAPYFGKDELSLLNSLGAFVDMALARARLTEQAVADAEELQEKNLLLKEFVAMVSHDLRSPINIITSYSDMLNKEWNSIADQQRREYVARIFRQGSQLSRLVDDLLTVSLLDTNAIEPEIAPVNVGDVVRRAVSDSEVRTDVICVDVDDQAYALADPHHLERILRNYLDNAMKYGMPPVEVFSRISDSHIEICVADGGQIPDSFSPHLFERFSRLDKAHLTTGTGLGLAIVKGLAETDGGSVDYERGDSGSSIFVVSLPIAYEDLDSEDSEIHLSA